MNPWKLLVTKLLDTKMWVIKNRQSPDTDFDSQRVSSRRTHLHKKSGLFAQFELNESCIADFLPRLRSFWRSIFSHLQLLPPDTLPSDIEPMRAELFSAERMEQHGKILAGEHVLSRFGLRNRLLDRLDENAAVLNTSCAVLTGAVKSKSRIAPAGEWLLDNFYLIEEQIRTAHKHLPRGYSRELPRLAQGPSRGLPRVYDIALEVIAHGDGRVDAEVLHRFIVAYQSVTPLLLGELWAIPIMLRLALIENLRRVAARITAARVHANQAEYWANAMIDKAEHDPKYLIVTIAEMARSEPPMVSAFVAELSRRLQGHGSSLLLPMNWVSERLAESSLTIEQMVSSENQQQAADQMTISNTIGSLRALDACDWRIFVEQLSVVEQRLRAEPQGMYAKMAFVTRDQYRQVIDRLAKRIRLSEAEVTDIALSLAASHADADHDAQSQVQSAESHVGYYLVDKGLPLLERAINARISILTRWRRRLACLPLTLYLSKLFLFTALTATALIWQADLGGLNGWRLVLFGLFAWVAASQLGSALTQWFAMLFVSPTLLPRMNYEAGIPEEMRTLVVVPTLLSSANHIDALLSALEVRFLGNRDKHLHFALLTDYCDAKSQTMPEDEALLMQVQNGIKALNQKYDSEAQDRFYLFHRRRFWNAAEECWMGYERKRGKLADLNALLMGNPQTHFDDNGVSGLRDRFEIIVGDLAALTGAQNPSPVKYIITLDTDTELPRDAARECVATMAHPLNRPRYNSAGTRVVAGYGLLQPRMAVNLIGAGRSLYAKFNSSEPGIDPYTRSVSDVYQDVFGEGSFIGKGIYDIAAFEHTLNGRMPENRILSHDLLEGCYVRSGLLSDVQLYEEYPSHYHSDVSRRERWIRGDWQIASWIFPWVPGANGKRERNPLSALSRWKIFDNLLRSLVPMAMLMMLVIGWLFTSHPWFWTVSLIVLLLTPSLLTALFDIFLKPNDTFFGQHTAAVIRSISRSVVQTLFRITCLPHEAIYSVEAAMRSTFRVFVSHKYLLQWNPFAQLNDAQINEKQVNSLLPNGQIAQRKCAKLSPQKSATICASFRNMATAPIMALVVIGGFYCLNYFGFYHPYSAPLVINDGELNTTQTTNLLAIALVLLLWLFAPLVTWWMSLPLIEKEVQLSASQLEFLGKIARKTWAYFDRYVNSDDHWLPPDNVQELGGPTIAHRTSPTNMGLNLLANLAAYDFAFIGCGEFLQRTFLSLQSMQSLERHQGHFYNWYDTQTLLPLAPRYISSVDSGNLGGHLLTLRAGLWRLPEQKIVDPRLFEGLRTTLHIIDDILAATALDADAETTAALQTSLKKIHLQVNDAIAAKPIRFIAIFEHLESIARSAVLIYTQVQAASTRPLKTDLLPWIDNLSRQAINAKEDMLYLAPWLTHLGRPEFANDPRMQSLTAPFEGDDIPSLTQLAEFGQTVLSPDSSSQDLNGIFKLGYLHVFERLAKINQLITQLGDMAVMEYAFLYDHTRHLLAIGYNVDQSRRDTSYYDLLASEARLSCFVAIAQGQIPQESWFALGRLRTATDGEAVLVSWSGSMFEYLMPNLILPNYKGTLLEQTCRAAVARQIAYGRQQSLPWGISESGYNFVDANLNYQYHAFGVPGLGFQRGLADDYVVAPYASALALMVAPEAACENLQRLSSMGIEGPFGFYEAIDFTPSRLAHNETMSVVRSFMAHHQGMSLLSLAYVLHNQPMQKRFEADPQIQATLLLLQERIPKSSILHAHVAQHADGAVIFEGDQAPVHAPIPAETAIAEVQLLSNGQYHVMVSNAGAGYSRCKDLAVTRWREDGTSDPWGNFIYLRDTATGDYWSNTLQPTLKVAEFHEVIFSEWRAEYRRRDFGIETYTELVVSPEDNIELRRIKLTNRSRTSRTIELTSFSEVVLTTQAADIMQTAFAKLFVQTEIVDDRNAILCTRRPRSATEATPWMFHLLATHGAEVEHVSYETDRMKFIGRGRTTATPAALAQWHDGASYQELSGSKGSVLDPIVAIRCYVTLEPEQSMSVNFVSGVADSREASMAMVEKYRDRHLADRVFDLAYTHSSVTLRQINTSEANAALYRRFARSVIYNHAHLRAEANLLIQNRRGQSGLWGYAISGDLPIVLLRVASSDNIELVRQMIQCHAYWRIKGLVVDLVIWNEDHVGYRQRLQDQIMGLISNGSETHNSEYPGGIFVRSTEHISVGDRVLLQSVARAIIIDSRGSLAEQIHRRQVPARKMPKLMSTSYILANSATTKNRLATQFADRQFTDRQLADRQLGNQTELDAANREPLLPADPRANLLANGLGGFSEDGREYIITTSRNNTTPLPWVNVLANPHFGTVISDGGLAYTWSENAHEFRLTPWSDDPVGATSGEVIYLRDEDSGLYWSPTPLPLIISPNHRSTSDADTQKDHGIYTTRHGFGYSVFEHSEGGIESELWVYVDLHESVKYSVLKIRNQSGKSRRLSATGYVEWVLGDLRSKSLMHVITEIDARSGALFARNSYNSEFPDRVAFFDVDDTARTLCGDRSEFIGRNHSIANPDALTRTHLSGRLGAALDPCGAIHVPFELENGQSKEIIFRLGTGKDLEQTRNLALKLRTTGTARNALQAVLTHWQKTLSSIQVKTPNAQLNVLANGWLLYQTLACRFWGRSGFYQSGGAFGFRDQLQDSMALVHAQPQLMREHLLRSAQRQYPEGDVQHWWHPPLGRGVRTRCSDDFLWLPLVACVYIKNTGDDSLLDEYLPFLEGRDLVADEESYYDLPTYTTESATFYQHCVRAIRHGLRFGEHGLPLMGSGDWNDGMNLVGIEGRGESVWLGFFLFDVLTQFAKIAELRNDDEVRHLCSQEAEKLRNNLERHGWDGGWYRRAYFDDGTALGSANNEECSIDSISQSWAVLSGAGSAERTQMAMNALDQYLVRRDRGIIQLLDPPFNLADMNPGYIKGYVPGVRENGGQYTHAAVWAAMAFAKMGDRQRAWELFEIINPLNHTRTLNDIQRYKAEPYVLAADVYAIPPHTGRGGWTWYTGSAGLYYRLIIESLLGIQRQGDQLFIAPCLPSEWTEYALHYRYEQTQYHIKIVQTEEGVDSLSLDGIPQSAMSFSMVNDQRRHMVVVQLKV
jgi:cyclic beta-1,2-glucan synthetase